MDTESTTRSTDSDLSEMIHKKQLIKNEIKPESREHRPHSREYRPE